MLTRSHNAQTYKDKLSLMLRTIILLNLCSPFVFYWEERFALPRVRLCEMLFAHISFRNWIPRWLFDVAINIYLYSFSFVPGLTLSAETTLVHLKQQHIAYPYSLLILYYCIYNVLIVTTFKVWSVYRVLYKFVLTSTKKNICFL